MLKVNQEVLICINTYQFNIKDHHFFNQIQHNYCNNFALPNLFYQQLKEGTFEKKTERFALLQLFITCTQDSGINPCWPASFLASHHPSPISYNNINLYNSQQSPRKTTNGRKQSGMHISLASLSLELHDYFFNAHLLSTFLYMYQVFKESLLISHLYSINKILPMISFKCVFHSYFSILIYILE